MTQAATQGRVQRAETFEFKPAVRQNVPALVALAGPSGSGKTYTALALATGLGADGEVFVVDTENLRAKYYADQFAFRHASIAEPFEPERFVSAINAAVKAGAAAIVLDTATPEWEGMGGVQWIVDSLMQKYKGNKFAAWNEGTPRHNAFMSALIRCPVHLVVTVRSKMAYEQVERDGRKQIVKLGLQPIQRPNFEYEFPMWLDLDEQHTATVSRSCWSDLQDQRIEKPGPELGVRIREWLDAGATVDESATPEPAAAPADPTQKHAEWTGAEPPEPKPGPKPATNSDPDDGEKTRLRALIRKQAEAKNKVDKIDWKALEEMTVDQLKEQVNAVGAK